MVKHAVALLAAAEHVAALESGEPALNLSDGLLDGSSDESEYESVESTAEVFMADNSEPHPPPGYTGPRDGHTGASHGNTNGDSDDNHAPLTSRTSLKLSLGSNVRSFVVGTNSS